MARDGRDAEAYAAALAGLPLMGPRRLAAIVRAFGLAGGWEAVRSGEAPRHPEVASALVGKDAPLAREKWSAVAARTDPLAVRDAHLDAGIQILLLGSDRYPSVLAADVEPPVVVFARGDMARLSGPRVGIVGTRRATSGGRRTALELGRDLAAAGVGVVSGLALGIDGAAHHGALRVRREDGAARVIGVVGTGLDVVYPRQHRELWREVGEQGLLLSEVPLGGVPTRWRFPARNRIIAALSDVLVVVESHTKGGALLTVEEAMRRDRQVMAVPGSVRSPASTGTNELLADGATPACSAADVLRALDLTTCERALETGSFQDDADRSTASLDARDRELLDQIAGDPVGLDQLAIRSGWGLGELSLRLARLEDGGHVVRESGLIERVSR